MRQCDSLVIFTLARAEEVQSYILRDYKRSYLDHQRYLALRSFNVLQVLVCTKPTDKRLVTGGVATRNTRGCFSTQA